MKKIAKKLTLAAPSGFSTGAARAVQIVEVALEELGTPVYVRHEIEHHKTVVEWLSAKGSGWV